MPTYVYECAKCGDEFELYQSFSDDPLKKHPGCGGKVAKVFQPVGIVLKGSGFYKNDSRGNGKRSNGSSKSESSSETADSGSKSESSTADKKTDTKKSEPASSSSSKKKSESSTSSGKSS